MKIKKDEGEDDIKCEKSYLVPLITLRGLRQTRAGYCCVVSSPLTQQTLVLSQ